MDKLLENKIKDLIRAEGRISFAKFMDMALYEEGLGYYQKQNPFGTQGSFYTSVNSSSAFGFCIAEGIRSFITDFGIMENICEMGAGNGLLANDILNYYSKNYPEFYSKIKYFIIEKSSYLSDVQKETLKAHAGRVEWLSFEHLNNFEGVFFSNELVDAFPVHRIIRINGDLKELYVIEHEGKLTFYPDEFSTKMLEDYVSNINVQILESQIADINLDSVFWIKALGDKISKGVVFTIDYGFMAEQLYAPFRMDGTVTCYFKHTQNNNFFENVGFQDITAFVDFSALKFFGNKKGLEFMNFMPQWTFLLATGILNHLNDSNMTDLQKSSIKSLILPEGGFGTNFHVLIQSKNIADPKKSTFSLPVSKIISKLTEDSKLF